MTDALVDAVADALTAHQPSPTPDPHPDPHRRGLLWTCTGCEWTGLRTEFPRHHAQAAALAAAALLEPDLDRLRTQLDAAVYEMGQALPALAGLRAAAEDPTLSAADLRTAIRQAR